MGLEVVYKEYRGDFGRPAAHIELPLRYDVPVVLGCFGDVGYLSYISGVGEYNIAASDISLR